MHYCWTSQQSLTFYPQKNLGRHAYPQTKRRSHTTTRLGSFYTTTGPIRPSPPPKNTSLPLPVLVLHENQLKKLKELKVDFNKLAKVLELANCVDKILQIVEEKEQLAVAEASEDPVEPAKFDDEEDELYAKDRIVTLSMSKLGAEAEDVEISMNKDKKIEQDLDARFRVTTLFRNNCGPWGGHLTG